MKKKQSKLSMVMPVYNKKDDIGLMLESVYNQVWDNIELIMVNDGATDGTGDIIDEWLPKFQRRGYSVQVINQENQGISAAVRNGMLCVTGELFCTVDCDDWLHPEYVSTMASWLDEHPEYDYAACGFERITGTKENPKVNYCDDGRLATPASPNLAESILLFRTNPNSWIYLARMSYIRRCGIIENFVTEPRLHQEPSISIPLAMGGGKIKYFPDVLYRHPMFDREHDKARFPGYVENLTAIRRRVIESFPDFDEKKRKRLLNICEFSGVLTALKRHINQTDPEEHRINLIKKAAELTNVNFIPAPRIDIQDILQFGHQSFFNYLGDCILELRRPTVMENIDSLNCGRIICYGALGKNGAKLLPLFKKTKLKPDLLWDQAAKPGDSICDLNVVPPDFNDLKADDLLIILPSDPVAITQILSSVEAAGSAKYILYPEIKRYIVEYCFADLINFKCKYIYN